MADTPDKPDTPKPAKPATTRRRAPRKSAAPKRTAKPASETAAAPAPTKRAAPPKPRSTTRATPPAAKRASTPPPAPSASATPARNWRPAAIAGGIAALGAAATAALLSLRSSSAKPRHAHTPDGRDASKSFTAGIADENSIPDGK